MVDDDGCIRCNERPPASAYQCLACGVVETEHPFPLLGCRCIANAYLCLPCLAEVSGRR